MAMRMKRQFNISWALGAALSWTILGFNCSKASGNSSSPVRLKAGDRCFKNGTTSCLVDHLKGAKVFFDKCPSSPADRDCCPPRGAQSALICNEDPRDPSRGPRYCQACKLEGSPCSKDAECCSSLFSVAPELGFRGIRAGAQCGRGHCAACLPVGSPCKDGRLACCNEEYQCSRDVWYDAYSTPTWSICGPDPCQLNLRLRYRQAVCRAGANPNFPRQYEGVNFCRCPADKLTGYRCSPKCTQCGLEGGPCADKADCCEHHTCGAGKCRQKACGLQGGSCAERPCCGKMNCLQNFKICTVDECRPAAAPCAGTFQCCEPLSCLLKANSNEGPKCMKIPPKPGSYALD